MVPLSGFLALMVYIHVCSGQSINLKIPHHSPTSAPPSEQCKAGYLVQGSLAGPHGPPGRDGLPGPAGPPGAPGASGVDLDELRQIVRLIAKEELKNLTLEPPHPVKVVVEHDKVCPITNPSTSAPGPARTTPTTRSPTTARRWTFPPGTQPPTSRPTYQPSHNRTCPLGLHNNDPADSCLQILRCNRHLASGWYWIKLRHKPNQNYGLTRVYCRMEDDVCGVGGLTRVAYLNMNDTNTHCPFPLTETIVSGTRMCTSPNLGATYSSVEFDGYHIPYNFVCGRAVGYQYYSGYAFYYANAGTYPNIDQSYIDGLSITYKVENKREHIWSLAGGYQDPGDGGSYNCPCAGKSAYNTPLYVGNDQYCESGVHDSFTSKWYLDNPLWDGKGCHSSSRCCDNERQPWFWRMLPKSVNSDIEVRWMRPIGSASYNYGISLLELYVR